MKDVKVYIAETLVDLVPGQAVAMSYQLNDIADIKNQRANFSNIFKCVRTKETDRKLGFTSDLNSTDKRPYRMLPARIIIDGEDVVTNGYAVIKKVDKYYNVLVYSGLIDLFTKLGDAKLSALPVSGLNHPFTQDNVETLLASTEDFCYPIIDNGQLIIRNTVLVDYMRPAVYVKYLFEKLFESAGFDFTGSFLEHPDYPKLLLPFTNDKLTDKAGAIAGSVVAEVEDYAINNVNVWTAIQDFTVTSGNGAGNYDAATGSYEIGSYTVRGKFSFEGRVSDVFGGTQKIALRIESNLRGTLAYVKYEILGASVGVKIAVESHDYIENEVIRVHVKHNNAAGVSVSGKFTFVQDNIVPVNGYIPMPENLPDMKQKDLLKSVAQMYGLIYDIDLDTNNVRIRFFDDLLVNKANAKDWSDKLDVSVQDEKQFALDFAQVNNFNYNNGTETEDEANPEESGNVPYSLGRATLLVDNTTLKPEANAVDLVFAATAETLNTEAIDDAGVLIPLIKIWTPTNKIEEFKVGVSGGILNEPPYYYNSTFYASVPNYDAGKTYTLGNRVRYDGIIWEWQSSEDAANKTPGVAYDNGDTGTNYTGLLYWKVAKIEDTFLFKQTIKVKPRILLANVFNGSTVFFQSEQHPDSFTASEINIPYFQGALDFETLLTNYYKVVKDTTDGTKLLRAFFTLGPDDVKNIDHLTPVYVKYYSNYFYVQLIDKYQQGQSTPVDLVKL